MPRRPGRPARAGFTLIEVAFTAAIFALLVGGTVRVLESSRASAETVASNQAVENLVRRALTQLVDELRDAAKVTLSPTPSPPFSTNVLDYQLAEGAVGGVQVLGAPRRLRFDPASGQVLLTRDVGGASERTTILLKGVPALLEGEGAGAGDDNGNGLEQETGLFFALNGQLLRIGLTLQRDGPDGQVIARTIETQVYCRN